MNETFLEIIRGLLDLFDDKLREIILYGSVAKGTATDESDVDIAIILNIRMSNEEKEAFLAWNADIDLKYGRVFSIIEIEKDKLDRWGTIVPFYVNLLKEGKVLWRAA